MNDTLHNPYVGPRTFRTDEGELFFGREREALDLLSLVISGRLVLFYAQSGAGKSSLINTKLIPGLLAEEEYKILPVGRVGGGTSSSELTAQNIYVYNLVHSLLQPGARQETLANRTLTEFLAERLPEQDRKHFRHVLIIDQFEELFSTYPQAWEKRKDFFLQLAQALEDFPSLWMVLVMREDYIAYLDPYVHLLPGKLRVRYYMQRLERNAALKAIKNPVEALRPFAEGVAEKLVNDLSSVRIQNPDGSVVTQPGQFIEPVQLQVVCYNLWDSLPPAGNQITEDDLQKVGDVNQALQRHYANRVKEVAGKMGVSERAIREWFGKKLITSSGTRNMVLQETKKREGKLDDAVIQALQSDLVRAEKRGPSTFYELTHDRLVEPIVTSNQEWFEQHLSPLQKQAALWGAQGRTDSWLLSDQALTEVEAWAREHGDKLTEIEQDFLEACQQQQEQIMAEREAQRRELQMAQKLADTERARAEERARSARTSRIIAGIASLLLVVALVLGFQSYQNQRTAQMLVLTGASSEALANGDIDLATKLAYQALITYGDEHGEVEEALATIKSTKDNKEPVEKKEAIKAPFIVSNIQNEVTALAVSPQGNLLSSGDSNGGITLWDLQGLNLIAELPTTYNKIDSISFSPVGTMLAAASSSTITLWNVDNPSSPSEIASLEGHTDAINAVAFSPDGKTLASGSADQTIILWDVATGKPIGQPLAGHTDWVRSVVFSPDGKTLASGSDDKTVRLWDVKTGQSIGEPLTGHNNYVIDVAFSPDGKLLASGGWDNTIILWDVTTRKPIAQPLSEHTGLISSLAFSPDGKTLASKSDAQEIFLWDISDPTQAQRLMTLPGSSDSSDRSMQGSSKVVFTPDGKKLASGSSDKVLVWDVSTRDESIQPAKLAKQEDVTKVKSMTLAPDNKTLATIGNDGSIVLSDIATGQTIHPPLHPDQTNTFTAVALSPDKKYVASGYDDGAVKVWETATGEEIAHMSHDSQVTSVAFSQDNKYLLSGSYDGSARVWEIASENEISIQHHSIFGAFVDVTSVAFSPDGQFVASGGDDNTILISDAHNGRNIIARIILKSGINSIAFGPGGTRLAIALKDEKRTVEVWDWKIKQRILKIENGEWSTSNYSVGRSINQSLNEFGNPSKQSENNQPEAPSGIVSISYSPKGLFILYDNGVIDQWEIWPVRAELEKYAEKICNDCRVPYDQRLKYELYTLPMLVTNYAGYLISIFNLILYGLCIRTIYRSVFLKSNTRTTPNGFSWKKFITASTQGGLLVLLSLLSVAVIGFFETFYYSNESVRSPSAAVSWSLFFALPLGLWPGAAYGHFTRRQAGKWPRVKRVFVGLLAGWFGGVLLIFAGLIAWGFLTGDFMSLFSDLSTLLIILGGGLLSVGFLMSILSFFGVLIYIFWIQPWSEQSWLQGQEATEEAKAEQLKTSSVETDQGVPRIQRRKTIKEWLQLWWARGIGISIIGALLGFVILYLNQGFIDSDSSIAIIFTSLVFGAFGFMFYPGRGSYILLTVLAIVASLLWLLGLDSVPIALWLGVGSGFILSAITSRTLHMMKKI
jgi:WD40 repeat protein